MHHEDHFVVLLLGKRITLVDLKEEYHTVRGIVSPLFYVGIWYNQLVLNGRLTGVSLVQAQCFRSIVLSYF
jgi:hypothetical protein